MCKKEQAIGDLLAKNEKLKQENFELKVYRKALHKWDNLQVLMLFEEMAELQKELCKNTRGEDNREKIAEEIADVEIMLGQMKLYYGVSEGVERFKTWKLRRLEDRLESEIMLTDSEKLKLINTMEFVESEADCDGVIYVLVEDNEINRGILHKIGLTEEDIEKDCFIEVGHIDISMVAFRYSNYYDSKKKVFLNKPELIGKGGSI